jgi:hypothetical protein
MIVFIWTAFLNLVRLLSLIFVELRSDPMVDLSLVGLISDDFSFSPCLLSKSLALVVFAARNWVKLDQNYSSMWKGMN